MYAGVERLLEVFPRLLALAHGECVHRLHQIIDPVIADSMCLECFDRVSPKLAVAALILVESDIA